MAEKESIFRKALNIIPPNVRQFTYDAFGGKEDFTEEKLSPEYEKELKAQTEELKKMIAEHTKVTYKGKTLWTFGASTTTRLVLPKELKEELLPDYGVTTTIRRLCVK